MCGPESVKWRGKFGAAQWNGLAWAMNNYWFTNFPAAQGGSVRYRFSLSSYPQEFDSVRSSEFGLSIRQPLMAAVTGT